MDQEQKRYEDYIAGRNAVTEALKSGRPLDSVLVARGDRQGSIGPIIAKCRQLNIPVKEVDSRKLDAMAQNNQGVIAVAACKEYASVEDLFALAAERGESPFIIVCDELEDPHNLGALIRCAECAGAHGIIIPKRHAVGITPAVYKSSAGAIEHMLIAKVSNLNTTIEELKEKGLWIYAAEAGGTPYYETDFNCGCGIILGSEGNGVSRLLKENSAYIVSIPMYGRVNSLNVSTAASVILCHVARIQRG